MRGIRWGGFLAAIFVLVVLPPHVAASGHGLLVSQVARGQLGQVRAIERGLMVQPPKKKAAKGKVKEALFAKYGLRTGKQQKASLAFVDGSVLHINQLTDAVLTSASVTQVKKGEVEQIIQPGSDHQVKTAAAVATAIGSDWDTQITAAKLTVITVVEGAVKVTGTAGQTVIVRTGQQTSVTKGQAPTPPRPANTDSIVGWAGSLPPPAVTVGRNLALAANGGSIVAASSTRASSTGQWAAGNAIDGDPSTGWQSAQGSVADQTISVRLSGGNIYRLLGVVIDNSATAGESSGNDLRDFEVQVSRDGGPYTTVLTGTAQQNGGLQRFDFAAPHDADHVQLVMHSSWGGTDGIALAEFEVIGEATAVATPAATAVPTATPTPKVAGFRIHYIAQPELFTNSNGSTQTVTFEVTLQVCGSTPFTGPWTGTLHESGQATDNGTTTPFDATVKLPGSLSGQPLPAVYLQPGVPSIFAADNFGGGFDLRIPAGQPFIAHLHAIFDNGTDGTATPPTLDVDVPVQTLTTCP